MHGPHPKGSIQSTRAWVVLDILVALAVLAAIWYPEFELWSAVPERPSDATIERARAEPPRALLLELGRMSLMPPSNPADRDEIIRQAGNVARGVLSLPGLPDETVSTVFSPDNLHKGSLKWRLLSASLANVDQLLDAYRLSGKQEFFELAERNVVAFAHFESSQWMDTGFLWNDHAIAARIPVLIKFWTEYREQPRFDPAVARSVLLLAARSGMLLAKPEHYAWRTGHGIVANLALLQISLAFPMLAESKHFQTTAQQRLAAHLPYYINLEGVTLLHSAGYAEGGVRFLAMALRLYTLAEISIPPDWWHRFAGAEDFLDLLRRPDGTLPMFGDTGNERGVSGPARVSQADDRGNATELSIHHHARPHRGGVGFFPQAGYAVWWISPEGANAHSSSQSVATWSHFPSLGHKHADELSILLWAAGRSWITNVGYWPYGLPGRRHAESWAASNAPHLVGEPADSVRTSRSVVSAISGDGAFIELLRQGPGAFSVRREFLQLGPHRWLVLDRFDDSVQREAQTLWTFFPDLSLEPHDTGDSFTITALGGGAMVCDFTASPEGHIDRISGSAAPFAGWVVIDGTPRPAPTVRVRSSSKTGWQLMLCSLSPDGNSVQRRIARVSFGKSRDQWSVEVADEQSNTRLTIARDGLEVRTTGEASLPAVQKLELAVTSDAGQGNTPVMAALGAASEGSTRRVPLISYRAKVSYMLLVLLLAQETLLFAFRRRLGRLGVSLRIGTLVAWVAGAAWLLNFYFVAG
jgi:hypothetical protein